MAQPNNNPRQAVPSMFTFWGAIFDLRRLKRRRSASGNWTSVQMLFLLLIGLTIGPVIGYTIQFFAAERLFNFADGNTSEQRFLFYAVLGVLMSFFGFVAFSLPSRYIFPALRSYPKSVYLTLRSLTTFTGALLAFVLSTYIIWRVFRVQIISKEYLRSAIFLSAILSSLVTIVISAFAKLRVEIRQAERLLYESKLKEQMLVERTATAQLKALQAQINPHFFFNTLSSIVTLMSINTSAAKELLLGLAEMYRYTLMCSNSKLVPLEEELEFVRHYLMIEEVRFHDRLKAEVETPASLGGLMLPGLTLQPLVENAIKYGIARSIVGGHIRITVKRDAQRFTITVSNSSSEPPAIPPDEWLLEGHALKNVHDRLTAICGEEFKFKIEYRGDEVRVMMAIPVGVTKTYVADSSG